MGDYGDFDDEFADTDDAVAGTHAEGAQWQSLHEINPNACLYQDMQAEDLQQGQIGDCWLISAMASIADSGNFDSLFQDNGDHYAVHLWSYESKSWEWIEVNDKVPCQNGKPCFVQPSRTGEIWPCILEKAFAKMCSGYAKLDGGYPIFAFGAMQGTEELYYYSQPGDSGSYDKYKPTFNENNQDSDSIDWDTEGNLSMDDLWGELKDANSKQYLMCAGSNSGSDTQSSQAGVVQGHAYTILDVREVGDFQLIQLRNPWGQGEWKGAWSDGSQEWTDNPDVAAELNPDGKEDGKFWMPWEAFQTQYSAVFLTDSDRHAAPGAGAGPCAACSIM